MSQHVHNRRTPALHIILLASAAILTSQAALAAGSKHPLSTIRPVARPVAEIQELAATLPAPPIRPVARPHHAPFAADDAAGDSGPVSIDIATAFTAPLGQAFTIAPDTLAEVSFATVDFSDDPTFMTFADLSAYRLPLRPGDTKQVRDPQVVKVAGELESVIIAQLESEYDMHNGEAGDVERLFDLADGMAYQDWGTPAPHLTAMQVTDARFEPAVSAAPAPTQTAAAVDEMRRFLATPEGLGALSQMSPEQIAALAQVMANPAPAAAPVTVAAAVEPTAPEMTSGVPPLSFGDAPETVDDGRILGGTTDLLLRDWRISRENGVTSMYLVNNPGSRIDVRTGMVLGALGAITGIDVIDDTVAVTFDNGEILTGEVTDDKIAG